ncbi:hypothetical protein Ccrd_000292 [Cynara cardunculus var. scolymus]|uniref:Uncharacterized protein n=1 Tax=Cynara cardunculus var. scolymus TaxID=59895 RepID=A0A118JYL0_CYNCS|nr:hypothetical protein Ccrd_000292 [Cynara cardunculus var. scolymus]
MSASSLAEIGAPLKLWITFALLIWCYSPLCCFSQQRFHLRLPTVSMRLRPKRTCSGVECFGAFHIQGFSSLFLFLRRPFFWWGFEKMPDGRKQLPVNRENLCNKKPKRRGKVIEQIDPMRTIRIICHDPDLTDSSDDDDEPTGKPYGRKAIVREIKIPVVGADCVAEEKTLGTEDSCQDSNHGEKNLIQNNNKDNNSSSLVIVSDHEKQAVSEESVGVIAHTSPSSVLEMESSSITKIFISDDKKMDACASVIDEDSIDLLPNVGFGELDDEALTLAEIGNDLDLGLDVGAPFLDDFVAPLEGFGNLDDFQLCGFDDKDAGELPDWDFGELNNEELAWINTLKMDEPAELCSLSSN